MSWAEGLSELIPRRLWNITVPAAKAGIQYGSRSTLVALDSGGLWVHSPVELTEDLARQVEALGNVAALVAPSRFHFEHLREWADRFPEAEVHLPASLSDRFSDLPHIHLLSETPPPLWTGQIDQLQIRGSRLYDEFVFLHPATETLIVTDLLFNIPWAGRNLMTRIAGLALGVIGRPRVSRSFRLAVQDRQAVSASLQHLREWDFQRIILSHGDIIPAGGHAIFEEIFRDYLSTN